MKALKDTWSWDGVRWSQVQDSGPAGRGEASLAPAPGGSALLFGGKFGAHAFTDTWTWDGTNWTQVADSGPDWLDPAMAYDPAQNVTVLFSNAAVPETWHWDGARWSQVDDSGPALETRLLAWDLSTAEMVLCGRPPGSNALATYVRTQMTWVQLSDMGPVDPVQVLMSPPQGIVARTATDTWLWNSQVRRWTQVQDMGGRAESESAAAWDEVRSVGVLFDGASGQTWTLAPPTG